MNLVVPFPPGGERPEDMARTLKAETEKFAELVKAGKVVLD